MFYFFSQSQNEPISRFWFPSLLLHHLVWLKCGTATLEVDLAFNPISTMNTCCTAQTNYLTSLGLRSLFCKNEKILSVLIHRDFSWELSESVKKVFVDYEEDKNSVFFFLLGSIHCQGHSRRTQWLQSELRALPSSKLPWLLSWLCLSDGRQCMKMILPLVRKEEINRQKKESLKPW